MNNCISDEEIAAAQALVPIARLIEQIVTYTHDGLSGFNPVAFPAEYNTWQDTAAQFKRSKVREVRRLGSAMSNVAQGHGIKRLITAWDAFSDRMVAEHGV